MTLEHQGGVPEDFLDGDVMGLVAVTAAGTVEEPDGSMTTSHTLANAPRLRPSADSATAQAPLARLASHLRHCSAGLAGRRAIERWRAAGIPTANAPDPYALARSCHGTADPARSAAVVRRLSALAPGDELAGLCVLVALSPALCDMARWLRRHGTPREDAEAAVTAACWCAVVARGGQSASAIVRATWAALREEQRRIDARRRREEPWADPPGIVDVTSTETVPLLLAEAHRAGALTDAQAALLLAVYAEDHSPAAVRAATGRSQAALKKARQRAERALREFVDTGTER